MTKLSVNEAERPLLEGLIEEELYFRSALQDPESKRRMNHFLSIGGQTRDMEIRPIDHSFELLAGAAK